MAVPKQKSAPKKESMYKKEDHSYKKEVKQEVKSDIKTPSWLKFKSKSKSLGYLP